MPDFMQPLAIPEQGTGMLGGAPIPGAPMNEKPPAGVGGTPEATLAQLVQAMQKAAQQKRLAVQPIPQQAPTMRSGEMPGYMTQTPKWGPERFMQTVGTLIHNQVAQKKQNDILKAEGDWTALNAAIETGNKPLMDAILSDPKKLKNMAKALNQDWLNPEKTTVYGDALKKVNAKQAQTGQAKQQAAGGLQALFRKLIGAQKQPQLDDQQKQAMAKEIEGKMPVAQAGQDPKALAEIGRVEAEITNAQANMTRAQTEARQKYDIRADADGNLVAVNKSDPKDVVRVTDAKGKEVTGASKGKNGPMLVNGVPVGVYVNGKPRLPGDPEWTSQDAKMFAESKAATAASDAMKDHRLQLASQSRAAVYLTTRLYPAMDEQGNETFVNAQQALANPGKFAPLTGAVKVKSQQAIFQDLHYTSGQLKQAIDNLGDQEFDAKSRAQLLLALRSNDPHSAFKEFISSEAASGMNDKQIEYATAVVAATEGAMMLRQIGGMGAGSDTLREAIVKLIPGPGTPSRKYAMRQLELYDGQLNRLEKAVPKIPGGQGGGDTADPLGILH